MLVTSHDWLGSIPHLQRIASNTQNRMNIVIGSSHRSATLTYEVIAVFVFTFGSKVCSFRSPFPNPFLLFNIRSAQYHRDVPFNFTLYRIGQLAIVILVLCLVPAQSTSLRNCLDKVFHAGEAHFEIKPFGDDEEDEDPVDEDTRMQKMTPLKHSVLTGASLRLDSLLRSSLIDLQMGEYISLSLPEFDFDLHSVLSFGLNRLHHYLIHLPGFFTGASIPLLHFARL